MCSYRSVLLTCTISAGLILSAKSFVVNAIAKAYLVSSTLEGYTLQHENVPISSLRRLGNRSSGGMRNAAGGSKKRRRQKDDRAASDFPVDNFSKEEQPSSSTEAESASPAGGETTTGSAAATSGLLSEVLQGDKPLESLFINDWTGMPTNMGMEKSNVDLPDISTYQPKSRPVAGDYSQREKKTAVGLTVGGKPILKKGAKTDKDRDMGIPESFASYKSKLPELKEEKRKSEKFEEGFVVKTLKSSTWFGVIALVAWEIYINSPLFPRTPPPPIS